MKKTIKDFCNKDFFQVLREIQEKNFSTKKRRFAVFDFETDNKKLPSVYSWAFLDEKYNFDYGIDIFSFLKKIDNLKTRNLKIYSQNGAKFDNYFIIPALEKYGFKQNYSWIDNIIDIKFKNEKDYKWFINFINFFIFRIEEAEKLKGNWIKKIKEIKKEIKILNKLVKDPTEEKIELLTKLPFKIYGEIEEILKENKKLKHSRLKKGEFEFFIDGNYKNFQIKLVNSNEKLITFLDAYLIFSSSLSEKGKTLKQEYGRYEFLKKELEGGYGEKEKYKSLEDFENDKNELEYLFFDVLILLIHLVVMDFSFPRKNWKLTAGSTAYQNWKYGYFTEKIFKNFLLSGKIEKKELLRGDELFRFKGDKKFVRSKRIKDKVFKDHFFPKLQEKIQNDILDNWYSGGLTNFNPKNQGLVLKNLIKLDITSSYPSVMMEKKFPYGWIYEGDKKENEFKFFRIEALSDLKNNFGLPFIKVFNKNNSAPYQQTIKKGTFLYLTSAEKENFLKYYKGKTEFSVVYSCKEIEGKYFFKDYIEYYFKLKSEAKNSGEKIIAKLMLNALYGKFGSKRDRQTRLYEDENFTKIENLAENEYYAPIAVAVAAYGRMKLVDLIGKNYEIFVGGDTDSVIIPTKFGEILKKQGFIGENLGEWKIEMEEMKGVFRRKKQYLYKGKEKGKEKYSFAFASINSKKVDLNDLSFFEFLVGKKIPHQNRPHRTPVGNWIEEYEKEILPIWSKHYLKTDEGLNLWFKSRNEFIKNYKKQCKERREILKNYEWKY